MQILSHASLQELATVAVQRTVDTGAERMTPARVWELLPGSRGMNPTELRLFLASSLTAQKFRKNHWSYDPDRTVALKQVMAALDTPEFRQAWEAA